LRFSTFNSSREQEMKEAVRSEFFASSAPF
jgi:hypothetical protein